MIEKTYPSFTNTVHLRVFIHTFCILLLFQILRGIFREEHYQSKSTSEAKRRKLKLEDTLTSSETSTVSTSLESEISPSDQTYIDMPSPERTPVLSDLSVTTPVTSAATSSSFSSSTDPKLLSECDKCALNKKKKRSLQKKYNRLQKKFTQIKEKLMRLQTEHVCVLLFFTK